VVSGPSGAGKSSLLRAGALPRLRQGGTSVAQRDQAIASKVGAEALDYGNSDTTLAAQLALAAHRIQPTQDLASRLVSTENTPLSSIAAAGSAPLMSVMFSPDGRTLATGDGDGTIRLWDVTAPARPRRLSQLPISRTCVRAVAFSPDGVTLAVGSDSGIQLWTVINPASPVPLGRPLTGSSAVVLSVAFSPNGHMLASGKPVGRLQPTRP